MRSLAPASQARETTLALSGRRSDLVPMTSFYLRR
jgi:hypothetical protein